MTASVTLAAGDRAPDFTLSDQAGHPVTLSALRGGRVIVYFYPEAETPACTEQACELRDNMASLTAAGYTVLGVSRDSVEKLAGFARNEALNFRLLSDPERVAHDAYGVWGEKSLYGKTVIGVKRSTFVIDADGVIEQALYNVKAKGHAGMLAKKLKLAAA